jgi:sigma-B regulation protein RsbU (phosphoserine phosphatase)
MNDQGEVVWHVNWELEGHNYREWRGEYPEMWALAEQALKTSPVHGDYEFLNPHGEAVKKYMTLIRIPGTEFIVCAAVETAKFFRPIHQTIQAAQNDATIAAKKGIQEAGSKYSDEAQTHLLILGVALLGIGVVSAGGFARSIVRPINRLLAGVQWIGQGRFDTTVEETGSDEVRRLAHEFNALGARLQEYTENLAEARAAEQRAESELRVAASIQQSLLPPLSGFPADRGVALHAVMQSAREVGGDFFDFFFLDERTMCFSVGDVCGKGVPAAILMALSKTLMETAAGMMHDPGKILEMVNDKLSVNNESCVFVTVFVGVLDTVSGELSYSNGGHEPPILVPAAGEPRWFEKPGGPALGLFPKEQFPTTRIKLEQGDCVIVFSDGVTEASDGDLSFFKDKMLNEIKKNSKEPRELVQGLFDRVVRLEQGAQADDITLLAIKFTAEHAAAPTSTAGAAA